jgi:aldose 1-epimerase
MTYRITTRIAEGVTGLDPTILVLEGPGSARAEVWPALGMNVIAWLDVLYADPELFTGGRPTRSGVPVLFPFPNRIRGGRFSWAGKEYSLPLNDSAGKNVIHGYACRHPWRIIAEGADAESAWVTGEFACSRDGGYQREMWPADHGLRLTVRLKKGALRLEAEVFNPDSVPLPFGLGYHPYFRASPETLIEAPAASYWRLEDSLPDGATLPVDAARSLNSPRPMRELSLDDVLTGLPSRPSRLDGMIERAKVEDVRLFCSPAFRELVVFTPPHRQAFCAEPYTCATDAVNLQQRGVEAGLLVLPPGETWRADVEFWV